MMGGFGSQPPPPSSAIALLGGVGGVVSSNLPPTLPAPNSNAAGHNNNASALPPPPPSSSASKPIRRRMRMITSCLECRRRKLKCNKNNPCTNCMKFTRDCIYLGPKLDEASQMRLTEIKEKVGSLERELERDVAKSSAAARGGAGHGGQQAGGSRSNAAGGMITDGGGFRLPRNILADDVEGMYDNEERDLIPTSMVALDLTYEDDTEGGTDETYGEDWWVE